MNIEITPMTAENVGAVSLLAKANLKEGWSEQTYLAQLSNPNDRTYIAYIDGVPCGFISAWIILDEIEINNIAVAPEYRRRGVAKALFARLYSDEAAARTVLEVRAGNAAAIALYEGLGFKQAGVRKNFYSEPTEDALIMIKEG